MRSGQPSETITSQAAWRAWLDHCAIGRCPPDIATELKAFGQHRFAGYLRRYAVGMDRVDGEPDWPDPGDAWHRFETHARTGTQRDGKQYKVWLATRADSMAGEWARAMESGASLLIRDTVREFLRREHRPRFMQSLDAPLAAQRQTSGPPGSSLTLSDLIPDDQPPQHPLDEQEENQVLDQLAREMLPSLSMREQIAIWARHNHFALSDPDVLNWAQCGKSVMQSSHVHAVQRFCDQIKCQHADESPAYWLRLARKGLARLSELIFLKISPEIETARFFKEKGLDCWISTDEQNEQRAN